MQKPGLQRPALPTTYEIDMNIDHVSDDLSSANGGIALSTADSESHNSTKKKKNSKLRLLGVIPLPGTEKKYSEDRQRERAEKRIAKMTRRPSWEASMTTGKY